MRAHVLLSAAFSVVLGSSGLRAQGAAGDTPEFEARVAQAAARARTGDFKGAEADYRALIPEAGSIFGAEDGHTLNLRIALARVLCVMGKYQEAEDKSRDLIHVLVRLLGPSHSATVLAWRTLAQSLEGQKKYDAAEAVFVAIIQALSHAQKEEHGDMVKIRCARAELHCEKGDYTDAAKELRMLIPTAERVLGQDSPDTLAAYAALATCEKAEGNTSEAIALMTRAYQGAKKKLGANHIDTKNYQTKLVELQPKKSADAPPAP